VYVTHLYFVGRAAIEKSKIVQFDIQILYTFYYTDSGPIDISLEVPKHQTSSKFSE